MGNGISVAVIGAGPAGLTAAYCLSRYMTGVEVYESSHTVGGLAKSLHLWGQVVDLGPHRFFSRDRRVNELWLEVVGRDYAMVKRLTRVLYQNRFFHYPLEPADVLVKLGAIEAVKCLCSYGTGRLRTNSQNGTFEGWICSRFGRRLFEIFFKSYSEKLWGIPCHELDSDFAAQRIKQFSLGAAIKSAFWRSGFEHRTLADEFAYPTGGTGMVYNRMADRILNRSGRISLNAPVKRVFTKSNAIKGIELVDGTLQECDHVISTMPLTLLIDRLPEVPRRVLEASRHLTFRNTILVYLEVDDGDICPDQWIYIHSPNLLLGRITNFRNWVAQLYGQSPNSILVLEYWCYETDELWRRCDEELIALGRTEVVATTLVRDESKIVNGKVLRIPRCYPVYRSGYKALLEPIRDYLIGIRGLQVIGRYGSFKYNNQDHSILMGILAAENLLKDAEHDLWSVNADYDTYQESCAITEAGLVATERN